jgi:SWI/SNF-related matrix-associated actin-dependent regulator 1 of chromatin subfamily A
MRVLGVDSGAASVARMLDQPLFPHQEEGIDFALVDGKPASMLAHDTGTGKARIAIVIADRIAATRVLVICPGLAVYVWRDQIKKWAEAPRLVHIVKDARDALPPVGFVIVTYDKLSTNRKLVRMLIDVSWDLLVIDEAHALKEPKSNRTRAVYGPDCKGGAIASSAARVVLLTGTPMLAHPGELWTHLRALRPELLHAPGRDSFLERYCVTKAVRRGDRQFEQIVREKPEAVRDLRQRLAPFMHRVRKRDVLKDLPPLLWTVVPIHPSDLVVPEALIKECRLAEVGLMRDVGVKSGDEMLAVVNASPHSATVRRLTGVIKVQAALAELRVELAESQGDKLIVFAVHRAVIDALELGLAGYGVVCIDGEKPRDERPDLIKQFQTDPRTRVFVGQISIASEAIELTAASNVWFIESDWTPKTMHQAASRAHRYGQPSSVNARILALEGSIDVAIARVLERKVRIFETIIEPENAF